jgi:hypothetical protein
MTRFLALGLLAITPNEFAVGQERADREADRTFSQKVWARRAAIEADLENGTHDPWEGTFYDGSPFHGLARGWVISRKAGFVSNSRTTDMGTVKAGKDRIALTSESPHAGLVPIEYVVVPWDKQVFLIEPARMVEFCNDVNSGQLKYYLPMGSYLLRVDDFRKERPTGMPEVPAEYRDYLLARPITARVVAVGEAKEDVAVRGQAELMSGTVFSLSVGKKDGVRAGMRFYHEGDGSGRFFVISLTDRRCEVLQEGKARIEVGVGMTTTDPFYDRK